MSSTLRKMTMVAAAVVAAVAFSFFIIYYYRHDPAEGGVPKCMFRTITGWDCPGCGSQRALHALLHGHIAEAWSFNPFVFIAVPVGMYYAVVEAGRARWPRLHAASVNSWVILCLGAAVVLYTVLRNLC